MSEKHVSLEKPSRAGGELHAARRSLKPNQPKTLQTSLPITLNDILITKCQVLIKKPYRNRNTLCSVVLGVAKVSLNLFFPPSPLGCIFI